MKHGTVIKQDGIFGYFAWPSIARLKDGRLATVCSGFRLSHICPFGKVAIALSSDEGESWSEPQVLFETPLDDRDAGITPFGDGFFLTTFNNTRAFQRGVHEKHPYPVEEKNRLLEERLDAVTDKEEADNLGSRYAYFDADLHEVFRGFLPITAPHGFTVLNDGTLFLIGRRFDAQNPPNAPYAHYPKEGIGYLTSVDGRELSPVTWLTLPEEELARGDVFCEPHAIQLKNGRILATIRVQNGKTGLFTVYACHSDDGGKIFSVPRPLSVPDGEMCGSPPHLIELQDGEVIMVYGYRKVPFGQRARLSFDGGESWSREIILRDDGPSADLGYPASVIVGEDLLTVYYQAEVKGDPCFIQSTRWNYREFPES